MLAGALLLTASVLAACGSISERVAEQMSELPAVGVPANAPARPTNVSYPAVNDVPNGPRPAVLLSRDEQQKIEDELVAARTRIKVAPDAPWQPEEAPAAKPSPARASTAGEKASTRATAAAR